jgi:hypothetical protein
MGRKRPQKGGKKKGKARRTELSYTPLGQHQRLGKSVIPPLARLEREANMERADWAGDRLPEMLWLSLLLAAWGREVALDRVRRICARVQYVAEHDEVEARKIEDVTLTGLAAWPEEHFNVFAAIVIEPDPSVFASLLSFDALPGKEQWQRYIGDAGDRNNYDGLKRAVAMTLWHQSHEATDCRWARVLAVMCSGRLKFPQEMEERVHELLEYPTRGEMHRVRPSIRATEGIIDRMMTESQASTKRSWPAQFWKEAFEKTRDEHIVLLRAAAPEGTAVTPQVVGDVRSAILASSASLRVTTAVDARHEGAFGLVLYATGVLAELLSGSNSSGIIARMALRSITEARITLAFLSVRDDPQEWEKYRAYGVGQAKLAYLKLLDTEDLPEFVSVEEMEHLANEDMWHEFREITLGNWAGSDLRKMSDTTGLKATVYDNYYDWTSAFVHANWGAVRDSVYDLCLNPLHRLHRIPSADPRPLPTVVADGWLLVRGMLTDLLHLYPGITLPIEL